MGQRLTKTFPPLSGQKASLSIPPSPFSPSSSSSSFLSVSLSHLSFSLFFLLSHSLCLSLFFSFFGMGHFSFTFV